MSDASVVDEAVALIVTDAFRDEMEVVKPCVVFRLPGIGVLNTSIALVSFAGTSGSIRVWLTCA